MGTEKPARDRIFNAAAEIADTSQRAAFLDKACGGNLRLRADVEDLLRRDEEIGSFLESPPLDLGRTVDTTSPQQDLGNVIGSYKLLQQLGEGGMGMVYLAERQGPVKQRVALKIIKLGMDSKKFIARFEAERQALAMMDHPNIATVLDAGCTDHGRPYFVMELVKGIPIAEFCDENRLTTCERLQLFIQVCQAVHHAHQKGIIHRDIKPSNVLVALYDQKPVPKVIDFGVAKATNQRLTERTLFTEVGSILGTWEYMSPEQAVLNQLDVDTRTDVYSLGVLLYELLTGETPLDRQRLRDAQLMETLRIIREEEPSKPSTRISSLGERATATAAYRGVKPEALASEIRGDLDWIVMKALAKERSRRYDSASRLADDVHRLLDNEPVEARPPSTWYQLQKFYNRNRLLVSSVSAVFLALIVGLATAIWGVAEAEQARDDALERESAYRELAFRGAMHAAVVGDTKSLKEFTDADGAKIPQDWRLFLEGMIHFYNGQLGEANSDFEQSLKSDANNMTALSLAAFSSGWQGNWNQTIAYRDRLSTMTPRKGYEEYDRVFNSLLDVYRDAPTARKQFRSYLEEYPHSTLVRLFYTVACYHEIWETGDIELARMNVERNVVVNEELMGDSQLAQFINMLSYAQFLQSADPDADLIAVGPNSGSQMCRDNARQGLWLGPLLSGDVLHCRR